MAVRPGPVLARCPWRLWLRRLLCFTAWGLLLLGPAPGYSTEPSPPAFGGALQAIRDRDFSSAAALLRAELANRPDGPESERARFLLGYALLRDGRPLQALPCFTRAADHYPLLGDYALDFAAQAAEAAGQPEEVLRLLSRLLARYPKSRLAEEAHFRLAMAYLDKGDTAKAEQALLAFVHQYPGSIRADEARLRLAELLMEVGRSQEAAPLLQRLMVRAAGRTEGDQATELLADLPGVPPLTPAERFERAQGLAEAGRHAEAGALFLALADVSFGRAGEARYFAGRSLFAQREYAQAVATWDPLTRSGNPYRNTSLFMVARALTRAGDQAGAIQTAKRLVAIAPESHLADDALFLVGLNQEGQRRLPAAMKTYLRLARRFPQGDMAGQARWRRAWLFYRQRKWNRALHELEHVLRDFPATPLRRQALYWQGRIFELQGKHLRAKRVYRRLLEEQAYGYYAERSRHRLGVSPEPPRLTEQVPRARVASFDLIRARELRSIALREQAAEEYWDLARRFPQDLGLQVEATETLLDAGSFDRAFWVAKDASRGTPAATIPAALWKALFPLAHWETVRAAGLDPYLVLALIREESAFDPAALSPAGAIGLMQLMPATARQVTAGRIPAGVDGLADPGLNIAIGTQYLAGLLAKFQGNRVYALASYNAGSRVVRRWLAENRFTDVDEFVEEIPYPETNGYVKRVLGSYDRYRTLYVEREQ
ncbi:MAG: transglycosylase SLT domain-containing protein [Candidatus Methylomirabilales bacterium]